MVPFDMSARPWRRGPFPRSPVRRRWRSRLDDPAALQPSPARTLSARRYMAAKPLETEGGASGGAQGRTHRARAVALAGTEAHPDDARPRWATSAGYAGRPAARYRTLSVRASCDAPTTGSRALHRVFHPPERRRRRRHGAVGARQVPRSHCSSPRPQRGPPLRASSSAERRTRPATREWQTSSRRTDQGCF